MASLPTRRKRAPKNEAKPRKLSTSKSEGGWQFLTFSRLDSTKDAVVRKIVRANATRYFRKSQRQRLDQDVVQSTVDPPLSVQGNTLGYPDLSELQICRKDKHETVDSLWSLDENCNWPNEWEGLLKEAQKLSKSIAPFNQGEAPFSQDEVLLQSPKENDISGKLDSNQRRANARRNSATNPQSLLGSGGSDPFDALPVKDCPQNSEYLHHCKSYLDIILRLSYWSYPKHEVYMLTSTLDIVSNVCARMSLPIDRGAGIDDNPLRKVWIPWILGDSVMFQATMTYAAAHMNLVHGRQNQRGMLVKKNQTMRMIKERFKNVETAMGNSTIGAIAMLAAAEVNPRSVDDFPIEWALALMRLLHRGQRGISKSFVSTRPLWKS